MKVEAYQCRHCESLHVLKKEMELCRRRCTKFKHEKETKEKLRKKQLEAADYIRLNAASIYEIPRMIEAFVEEYLDSKIDIDHWSLIFGTMSDRYGCAPIGKKSNKTYLGWTGRVKGNQKNLYDRSLDDGITGFSDLFSNYFGRVASIRGINTHSGGGGDRFGYDISLFLDDFPKIKEKYRIYKPLNEKRKIYNAKRQALMGSVHSQVVNINPEMINLADVESILAARLKQIGKAKGKLLDSIKLSKEYKDFLVVPDEYDFNTTLYLKISRDFNEL